MDWRHSICTRFLSELVEWYSGIFKLWHKVQFASKIYQNVDLCEFYASDIMHAGFGFIIVPKYILFSLFFSSPDFENPGKEKGFSDFSKIQGRKRDSESKVKDSEWVQSYKTEDSWKYLFLILLFLPQILKNPGKKKGFFENPGKKKRFWIKSCGFWIRTVIYDRGQLKISFLVFFFLSQILKNPGKKKKGISENSSRSTFWYIF